jgi:hypothetical protein
MSQIIPTQPAGQIVDDTQLEKLTIAELHALKEDINLAIRAVIRAKRLSKEAPIQPLVKDEPVKIMDLERERDAWLLAKR